MQEPGHLCAEAEGRCPAWVLLRLGLGRDLPSAWCKFYYIRKTGLTDSNAETGERLLINAMLWMCPPKSKC